MNKKIIFLLWVIFFSTTLSWGQTWNLSPTMTATYNNGTLTISTKASAEDMPVPSIADGYIDLWLYNLIANYETNNKVKILENIRFVTIGNGITSISAATFHGWPITSVTIGNSVKSIGQIAFTNCANLSSVTIPNSVTTIGLNAFQNCSGLTSLTLGNSVKTIENYAFWNCTSLKTVTIPNSVTSIGQGIFYGCTELESVTFGNSLTTIAVTAFFNCINLNSITLPNSVKTIEPQAFRNCSGLTDIMIPESVTEIGREAFAFCKSLKNVTVSWPTPLYVPNDIFYNVNTSTATLHVPAGTQALYEAALVWKDFFEIYSGNELVERQTLIVYASNGFLYITGLQPCKPLTVYSLTGQLVYSGFATAETKQIVLPGSGIYVVTDGKETVKVIAN